MTTGGWVGSRRILLRSLTRWFPVDAAIWYGAVLCAVWARFDFAPQSMQWRGPLVFATGAVLVQLVVGLASGVYAGRFRAASFEEAQALAVGTGITGLILLAWALAVHPLLVPRSTPFVATALALVARLAVRSVLRAYTSRRLAARLDAERVVIFGAGHAGVALLRRMRADGASRFVPVAMLDDDPDKRHLRVEGIRVRGGRDQLRQVADRYQASTVVVAVPQADAELLRAVTAVADKAGVHTLVLPPLERLMPGHVTPTDLREVDVEDLLGRRPARLDLRAITQAIAGRRVLVTGAGGSIGSELCRQIHRFGPAELVMLDRDESALHATQLSLQGRALLDGQDTALVDIRDHAALADLMWRRRPQVVFHAAALKHLPLLESYPLEAWKTNALGTANVLRTAADIGVETFVNISTDKAANPTSILGLSKRIAERITADLAGSHSGRFVSVRFGNVLGSRGSVLTAFEQQVLAGGPVTVTHPDVTRYFMTISEACQLVLQASTIGEDGECLVLDMGEPVKIVDVAHTMIERVPHEGDIEIVFTGLRPGEKLAEDLFSDGEPTDRRPRHPLVSHVDVPPLSVDHLPTFTPAGEARGAREWMARHGSGAAASIDLPELLQDEVTRG